MNYALIENNTVVNVIVADEDFIVTLPGTWVPAGNAGIGWAYANGVFTPPPAPEPAHAPLDPTEWLVDVGPFFDRFGPAKLAVLSHADALVQALVKDLQVRKWIDLKRADVAQGIDLLISKNITGVDAALKAAILTTPVTSEENLALRKIYFQ